MTDLTGKIAVVTGGNSGIGKETANELAGMGATVVIAARNPAKAAAAVDEIHTRTGAGDRVTTLPIDLASFASARAFVDSFTQTHDRLDILVNNAGLILRNKTLTVDGHESTFQVNHLSHFLLTNALRPHLERAAPARVVNVSSAAHAAARKGLHFDDLDFEHRRYSGWQQYCNTKLMNVLFTRELATRWARVVTANAVHPGFVGSNFGRDGDYGWLGRVVMPIARPLAISNAQGAITSVYVASSPDVEHITGQYFVRCKVTGPSRAALDDVAAARLWEISEQLTAG